MSANVAVGFGIVHALVTACGFIHGEVVFSLIPVNTTTNLLHLGLSVFALFAGLKSLSLVEQRSAR